MLVKGTEQMSKYMRKQLLASLTKQQAQDNTAAEMHNIFAWS